MAVIEEINLLEEILSGYKEYLGKDYYAYKNHLYRIVNYCWLMKPDLTTEENKKIIIAACFHDLGIWTNDTFDYLEPSIKLAKKYLELNRLNDWFPEIKLMINLHHKIKSYTNTDYPLVELFRKADWIDVSLGMRKFNLPKNSIRDIKRKFPNNGFHKRLTQLTFRELKRNPLNPLPMMKW